MGFYWEKQIASKTRNINKNTMTISEQLMSDLKDAMRAGDALKRDTVRSLMTMIKNEAIAQKTDVASLSDDVVQVVLKRAKKQRDDAATQYADGNRAELAQKESAEAQIISAYLPEQMSEGEVHVIVDAVISEIGKENFGAVMGRVMAQTKGQADGVVVKRIVDAKMI